MQEMSSAFKPIRKEDAAEILGVSLRSIDNYISDKQMPEPGRLGRRVYWHPELFYEWLDAVLRSTSPPLARTELEAAEFGSSSDEGSAPQSSGVPRPRSKSRSKDSNSQSTGTNAMRSVASRDAAILFQLAED
ncbi:MAG: hypothetical protein NVS3B25_33340 [Hymenobacter sp.]